ncbi:MAG: OmpA family protein [Thalassobaculaceae bacterium]|nr:OmpA family protein [Thalassobaculaceae bacterium]
MLKKLATLGGLLALAGCGVADVDAVRTVEPSASAFNNALTREYQELARFEADEMYDWPSAVLYARKGLAAAQGEQVLPFELSDWDLPRDRVGEMTESRATLLQLLNASARAKVPAAAADAQGKFDCWVEQQTENHQPNDIAACRDAFYAALGIVKAEMTPAAPAPQPAAAPESKTFTIHFDFDSTAFTEIAQDRLIKAIAAAKRYSTPVVVVGHTDTAGSSAYNMILSRKRAEAVKTAFERSGVADVRIIARGVGEQDLLEQTPDATRNPFNRRVTITIE